MQRQIVFFVITGAFIATTIATLLGVLEVVTIKDGYLTPLVGAFLLELAAAFYAVVKRADFFPPAPDGLAKALQQVESLQSEVAAARSDLAASTSANTKLQGEIDESRKALAALASVRNRVLSVIGAAPDSVVGIHQKITLGAAHVALDQVQMVIGQLVTEGEIEADPRRAEGTFRKTGH